MTLELDALTTRKLAFAKQLFLRSKLLSEPYRSQSDKSLSVIIFDLVIETVLRTFVNLVKEKKIDDFKFPELLNTVSELLKENLTVDSFPLRTKLEHVHTIRNNVQHKGLHPSDSDIGDAYSYTREFLQTFLPLVWGKNPDQIHLGDLIEKEDLREDINKAEEQLQKQNYKEAVKNAISALDGTIASVEHLLIGWKTYSTMGMEGIMITDKSGNTKTDAELLDAIKRMQETLWYVALSIDPVGYKKYEQIRQRFWDIDDKIVDTKPAMNVKPEDAEFMVSFCTETILQIQDRVGNIDFPYGKAWSYWL